MHLFFIDESGTVPPPGKINTRYFVLSGTIIPSGIWHQLKKDFELIKKKYSINGEIKWRFFSPTNKDLDNHLSGIDFPTRCEFRDELFKMISRYKSIRMIHAYSDVSEAYQKEYITHQDDIYWHCYKALVERYQYYLQDKSRDTGQQITGLVICDHRERSQDRRLRHLHHNMLENNRYFFSNYGNLIETVFFAPSELSLGIQLSDIVAGSFFRKIEKNDSRTYDIIKDCIRSSQSGKIDGYGIVKVPKT
ncbi:MAG: DUF3800 domain-containing protein [Sedimentisphaerales bacterium]|nr:DUF3800 domain-containing protein [Sedimentisphaerales bacterium]